MMTPIDGRAGGRHRVAPRPRGRETAS